MTDPVPIMVDLADGIARLTLNRPARRNALDIWAMDRLATDIELTASRADVRCLVLTGSGGAFCSGADLRDADPELSQHEENVEMLAATSRAVTALVRAPVPVVAEVEGAAAGVGASLALACDLAIASRTSFFLLPFAGIGLVPDGGATLTVAASIGRARAMRMALLQERLSATAAYDLGLIAEVCEPQDLSRTVNDTTRELASGATRALARTKAAINAQSLGSLDAALAQETEDQLHLLATWEFREGVAAFRERRRPDFLKMPPFDS